MSNDRTTRERAARRTVARGEIRQGTRLTFLHGTPDPWEGVVIAPPSVTWDGVEADARLSVSVTDAPGRQSALGQLLSVSGRDVFRVFVDEGRR